MCKYKSKTYVDERTTQVQFAVQVEAIGMAMEVTIPIAIGISAPNERTGKLHQSGFVPPMVVVSLPDMMKSVGQTH